MESIKYFSNIFIYYFIKYIERGCEFIDVFYLEVKFFYLFWLGWEDFNGFGVILVEWN